MQHQKIYVSDLDGTLLADNAVLSDYSRGKLTELLEAGVHFTVASARAWDEIQLVLKDLPLQLPVIAVNGAYLTDYATGEHQVINNMSAELAASVYQETLDHDLLPFVVGHDGTTDRLYWEKLINAEMQWYHDILTLEKIKRLTHIERLEDALDQKVIAYAVMGPKENVYALSDRLAEEYPGLLENFLFENPYSPGHWWLTIHDQAACKSKGIRTLVEMTGHSIENLTVFGDHINDIKMLQMAGKGITVANAEPQVKAVADEVIGSNEEDAVVKYILEQENMAV
ncbi:MAG: Cof-type HAD-IIB family hydrolase [Planctomycetota bacterium]|jgi:Cof subfamily protein (haloacid dehalogenase superfamily)